MNHLTAVIEHSFEDGQQSLPQHPILDKRPLLSSTNPPSLPPPTATAEKLYLQIRICGEQSSGSKYVKKEYRIELPANVVGFGVPWLDQLIHKSSSSFVIIPVSLRAPDSDFIKEATQA